MVRKSTVKAANKELQNNNPKHQIHTNHSISYLRILPNNCFCQLPKLRISSNTRFLTVHKSKGEIDLDNIYANGNYGSVSSRRIPPGGGGGGFLFQIQTSHCETNRFKDKVEMYFSQNLTTKKCTAT